MTNNLSTRADFGEHIGFIWSIAELLRGNYKQSEYGKVVLPFTVLRRLDCVLVPTKDAVQAQLESLPENIDDTMRETMLNMASGNNFHNTSPFTFERLLDDPDNIAANLNNMINGFSYDARDIFIDRFNLPEQVARLDRDNLLYLIVSRFAQADLHPDRVSNLQMGYIFEELIRRFSEQSNETAGEHFTPREVIRLMVNLLFLEDEAALTQRGIIRKLYDPACGTGGMLSIAEDYLRELNPEASLIVYGQELNDESYATCKSDMMIKGQDAKNIHPGNSFTEDGLPDEKFDYLLSNPPFGVEWKKVESEVKDEANLLGYKGRFGAGLPRVSDGSLLFVQHMISKFNQNDDLSRLAVVLNGSPLFTGSAGSGESEIRRWIIENDYLEAIIALPTDMFYNTGIATYIWIITNQKTPQRKGKVQLINATDFHVAMIQSLGSKRKEISDQQIAEITQLFGDFEDVQDRVKIFDNVDFGYQRITVERPLKRNFQVCEDRIEILKSARSFTRLSQELQQRIIEVLGTLEGDYKYKNRDEFIRLLTDAFTGAQVNITAAQLKLIYQSLSEYDETADVCTNRKGEPEPDPDLRDYENVPLREDIDEYFEREIQPHVPDAWIDYSKTKVGYEIPFNRYFYTFKPPRPLDEIGADLIGVTDVIVEMIEGVTDGIVETVGGILNG
ncbi:MAG: class I SAM-dependent DNA methyltransferase [Gemmatimonadetes bacterium]|nr:class I SAM-dependent DNA methyltransferase [Gemmatimonadota bacterium]